MMTMPLQFHRSVRDMEIWSATSEGFSFVISFGSPRGPGFHGRAGYLASWRPLHKNQAAIKIGGSPFRTLAEAEGACSDMAGLLAPR
ncbi:hypothetical protein [Bradyrhizobium sp. BRP20]|uniref:hypothetical protein n=1 Tax=Bradyrhizobium sp. BRP20 TaxID=2793822 RepID=UPI001CD54869|nr:hypothetical protein [Bradyrhizobium sp. BRP20]